MATDREVLPISEVKIEVDNSKEDPLVIEQINIKQVTSTAKTKPKKTTESSFDDLPKFLEYLIQNPKQHSKLSVAKFIKEKEITDIGFTIDHPMFKEMWKTDKSLAFPVALLKDITLSGSVTPAKNQVSTLAEDLILFHPLFKYVEITSLTSLESSMLETALKALSFQDLEYKQLSEMTTGFKKNLKKNILISILLLNSYRGVWTLREVVDKTGDFLWGKSDISPEELILSKDVRALGAVYRSFHVDLERQNLINVRLNRENAELKVALELQESKIRKADNSISTLSEELELKLQEINGLIATHKAEETILLDRLLSQKMDSITILGETRIWLENLERDLNSALHASKKGKNEYAEDFIDNNLKKLSEFIAKLKLREE